MEVPDAVHGESFGKLSEQGVGPNIVSDSARRRVRKADRASGINPISQPCQVGLSHVLSGERR